MVINYPSELPLVYVIARYSDADPEKVRDNTERAIGWGAAINQTTLAWALVPHQVGRDMESSLAPEGWYGLTRKLMRRCDAVWVVDQETDGCAGEIADAFAQRLPVGFPALLPLRDFLAGLAVTP